MLEYYKFKQIADLFADEKSEEALLQLAELQRRYVALSDENLTYRTQIQEYEDILYLTRNLFFDGRFYWLTTGPVKQGPFCAECYNRDGLLVRLAGQLSERHCPYCRLPYPASAPVLGVSGTDTADMDTAVQQDFSTAMGDLESPRRGKVIPFKAR